MRQGTYKTYTFSYTTLGTENNTAVAASVLSNLQNRDSDQFKFVSAGLWLPATNPAHVSARLVYLPSGTGGLPDYVQLCELQHILNITSQQSIANPFIAPFLDAFSTIRMEVTCAAASVVILGSVVYELVY